MTGQTPQPPREIFINFGPSFSNTAPTGHSKAQDNIKYIWGILESYFNIKVNYGGTTDIKQTSVIYGTRKDHPKYWAQGAKGSVGINNKTFSNGAKEIGNHLTIPYASRFTAALFHETMHALNFMEHHSKTTSPFLTVMNGTIDNKSKAFLRIKEFAALESTFKLKAEDPSHTKTIFSWEQATRDSYIENFQGDRSTGKTLLRDYKIGYPYEIITKNSGYNVLDLSSFKQNLKVDINPSERSPDNLSGVKGVMTGHEKNSPNIIVWETAKIHEVLGGTGNDNIIGNNLGNKIDGGAGNDTIIGGTGNDKLIDGAGSDVLTGGAGSDVFYYTYNNDMQDIVKRKKVVATIKLIDYITDFTPSKDKIYINLKGQQDVTSDNALQFLQNHSAIEDGALEINQLNIKGLIFEPTATSASVIKSLVDSGALIIDLS